MGTNIFTEAEKVLEKYRGLIGIGIMIMIILGMGLIVYSFNETKKIAEECGFDDGKVRCVCTSDAWNLYETALLAEKEGLQNLTIITQVLNS